MRHGNRGRQGRDEQQVGQRDVSRPWDPSGDHHGGYDQWRAEQMRSLGSYYRSWRAERYNKFPDEFTQSRSDRPAGDGGTPPIWAANAKGKSG